MAWGRTTRSTRTPVFGTSEPKMRPRKTRRTRKEPVIGTSRNTSGRGVLSGILTGRRDRGTAVGTTRSQPVIGTKTRSRRPSLGQRLNGLKNRIVGAVSGNRKVEAAGIREMHGKRRPLFGPKRHHGLKVKT